LNAYKTFLINKKVKGRKEKKEAKQGTKREKREAVTTKSNY
jgi:hypothetical protein